MASTISNQITFTEHKKIIKIRELYLATSLGTGVTIETEGWTESVQNIDYTKKYLWNYEEVIYSIGPPDISEPAIIGVYGDAGAPGAAATIAFLTNENVTLSANSSGQVAATTFSTDVVAYSGTDTMPVTLGSITGLPTGITSNDVSSGGKTTITFTVDNKATLGSVNNCHGTINIQVTSPINITLNLTWSKVNSGADGATGESAKHIKLNTTHHVLKIDKSGDFSPETITITPTINAPSGAKFKWWFAKDGGEFRTYWTNTGISVHTATETLSGQVELTQDDKTYVVIDGEVFKNSQYSSLAIKLKSTSSPAYEDVITIYKAFDGHNGADGKGISSIVNYYKITTDTTTPEIDSTWDTTAPLLTPTERFLWNYEVITYTDGSTTTTDMAIIGVYGDSGDGMVTFEIYSPKGFIFKEDTQSIDLKIAAFEGNTKITGATYKWEWWNDDTENYSTIVNNSTSDTFTVNKDDVYAFANLKCTMMYNGQTYEDYISLMKETTIYTSVVKFFNGSNIFYADDLYLVAYIELYQNNDLLETIAADKYCTGVSSLSGTTIIANITEPFSDGDKMYFVCEENGLYKVVLGQATGGTWKVIDNNTNYIYTKNQNGSEEIMNSNVVAISKESVNKSQRVDFKVYKSDADYRNAKSLSTTSANLIDSNDPIVSSSPPENPVFNQLWLDTSVSPHTLKIFTQMDGGYGEWTECTNQHGGSVFMSKPSSYKEGDLWILAEGEECDKYDENGNLVGQYGPGSMLKAKTNSSGMPMIAYLTNESVILAADSNGYVHGTTFSTDVAVCSATNYASNVLLGDITGLPNGITYKLGAAANGRQTIIFTVEDKVVLKNDSTAEYNATNNYYYGNITIPVLSPVEKNLTLKWSQVDGAYNESTGAKNITLGTTSQVIKVNEDGSVTPSTIRITPSIFNVETNEALYWRFSKNGGTFLTGLVGITSSPSTGSFTVNTTSYVDIDVKTFYATHYDTNTLRIQIRKRADVTSLYYEDIITIHTVSHTTTFNAADWIDADEELTKLQIISKQYFSFDTDTGLKIGQTDEKFYVNLRSTEMGFYDNSMGQNQKVVAIGNNAATIRNLAVYDEAEFHCNVTFNEPVKMFGFMWQEEDDESFSLVVV